MLKDNKEPCVRWEYHDGKLDIDFTGVPYIQLGYQEYHCHQGKDMNAGIKEKNSKESNLAMMADHCFKKRRKLTQPSKKMDCPVIFTVKKMFCFPEFKIIKDTKRNRTEASRQLKQYISEQKQLFEETVSVSCKTENKQSIKMESEKEFGYLKFIVKPPIGGHKYHHIGRAAGLIEPLDERINEHLKKLIRSGCRRVKELQSRAAEYTLEKIFAGEKHPDMFRRRFRPSRTKVKNLITAVKLENRHSKIDQENVAKLKEEWGKWADIYFSPR